MAKKMPPQGESKPLPLWPEPIPVIGLTGEYSSGKTIFGLSISPGPSTLVYDVEKSSESYTSLGFRRVDVPAELLKKYRGGYQPRQMFEWWRDHILAIGPGAYRVIMVDPVTDIESGLCDWVKANPGYFGHTPHQYAKMEAVMWADVRSYWKALLVDLAARCETFVFTAHLGLVFADGKPTSKKKPKGKSTLTELASLYLQLERKPDAKTGVAPPVPSAIVRKTRLGHLIVGRDGELKTIPLLPPRLPVATPGAIREYQRTPPDHDRLRPEERAPDDAALSDDERLELRARTAEAEAETERLRSAVKASPLAVRLHVPEPKLLAVTEEDGAEEEEPATTLTEEQIGRLAELRSRLFEAANEPDPRGAWAAILARRGVTSARDLTHEQAADLIGVLESKVLAATLDRDIRRGHVVGTPGEDDPEEEDEEEGGDCGAYDDPPFPEIKRERGTES